MATVILDSWLAQQVREQRVITGAYRWDEVWDGDCLIMPPRDNEHQELLSNLGSTLLEIVGWDDNIYVLPSTYVSDRVDDWQQNYRCPDVAVYLSHAEDKNCDSHWCGGPDFAVEIVSDDDRTRDKVPFYASVRTRELLIIDRDPWSLELLRLRGDELISVGTVGLGGRQSLDSEVLPLRFRLTGGKRRPTIEVVRSTDGKTWTV